MKYTDFLAQCTEELRLKTEAHDGIWQLSQADWDADLDAGTITFRAPNGMVATGPLQIIGTFNTLDSTWLWGWDHPSVPEHCAVHAKQVFDFGQEKGIHELTTRKLIVDETNCWEFTAIACKLCEAQGAYRAPSDTTLIFLTFGDIQLSQI
ncbi:hypothetical protein Psta_0202 [Pirellula staleyi DSM 6068]|uniref:Uncharacterized protein n=1 Tax=Pirellula staleyi (strain ATCC 27377 / DSM 6068 / ICPB 4128) TaxID=530564 RepID=D2R1B3_PIRSD|nr:DUF6882 domain-containing protein [Pirellula staleyi]ADB14898.1 hypothetical protein Psta_0202 [Pirellula staleyi DSM 6068]